MTDIMTLPFAVVVCDLLQAFDDRDVPLHLSSKTKPSAAPGCKSCTKD